MTLSGRGDSRERADAARAARQARAEASAVKRPWLMPLVIGIAVVALVGAVIYSFVTGLI